MEDFTNSNDNEDDDVMDDDVAGLSTAVAVWTDRYEEMFLEIMEEEVENGNKTNTTFLKTAWHRICESFNSQARTNYTDMQLRNKYNQLRIRHREFSKLIKESGVAYNQSNGAVSASEETWKHLCKVNKYFKKFRKKGGCPIYSKLCAVYGKPTTEGPNPNLHVSTRVSHETENLIDNDNLRVETSFVGQSDNLCTTPIAVPHINFRSETPSSSSRKRRANVCASPLDSKRKVYSVEIKEPCLSGGPDPRKVLIKESMRALNALEDIDGSDYSKAVEKFHEDQLWMELFLEMPKERRKDWVQNLK